MKNHKSNCLVFIICTTIIIFSSSCQKESIDNLIIPTPSNGINPFGVLPNGAEGVSITTANRVNMAKTLKANYVRTGIPISSWNLVSDAETDAYLAAGFKLMLNIDSKDNYNATYPFPTDMVAYGNSVNSILSKYTPAIAVIENEEANREYHSGSMAQYTNMLQTAIGIAHGKNIKITNGGLLQNGLIILVWKKYKDAGQTTQAADFAQRSMPQEIINDLPNGLVNFPRLQKQVAFSDTLLTAYATINIDYVNLHWYEPAKMRGADSVAANFGDTTKISVGVLDEVITYLKARTGKTIITNETGGTGISANLQTEMMQKWLDLKAPFVCFYSGDTQGFGKSRALYNGNLTLRTNGIAYQTFIAQKFP